MDSCENFENLALKSLSCKGELRCSKILDVAYRLFLENGYEKVSMNDIVKHSGGSLATLYKHFGNKEQLFVIVLQEKSNEIFADWDRKSICYEGKIEDFLMVVGKLFLDLIITDDAVLFHRLVVSVGYLNNPKLGELVMQNVMSHPTRIIATYLENAKKSKLIEVEDTMLCAQQFLHALKEPFMLARLLGATLDISNEKRDLALKQIVTIFYKGMISKY